MKSPSSIALLALLTLSLFFVGLARGDSPALPETAPAAILARWLAAFNAADSSQLQSFKQIYKRSWPVDEMLGWRAAVGGFEVLQIGKSEPLALSVLLAEKDWDRVVRAEVTLNPDQPGVLTKFDFRPAPRPLDLAVPRLSESGALTALIFKADQLADADRFSGAILIARHNQILLEKTWGLADRERDIPITPQTQFRLASADKMFTSVGVLQLVEAGKISLDATVGKYLPDYPNKNVADTVTVRELLRHTGGMGEYFGPDFSAHLDDLRTLNDYLRLFGARDPDHPPGTVYDYSSFGFIVLGLIIERVTRLPYFDYVDRSVFQPAGMTASGFLPETDDLPDRAVGYMVQKGGWVSAAATLPYRGVSAGGGYSTTGDLLRFAQALEAGKLLSRPIFLEVISRPESPKSAYGYGFELYGEDELFCYGHDGGAAGMNVRFRVFPRLGYVLVGLSNEDPDTTSRLVEYYSLRMPVTP